MANTIADLIARARVVRLTGDRILVKRDKPEAVTTSGLVIPESAQRKATIGTVLAVGPGRALDHMVADVFRWPVLARAPMDVRIGDRVVFDQYVPADITVFGIEGVVIMSQGEVAGVAEPKIVLTCCWELYGEQIPAPMTDIAHVVVELREDGPDGYADEHVVGIYQLRDGRWLYVTGWCDTTGWDCQSDAHGVIRDTLDRLAAECMSEDDRQRLTQHRGWRFEHSSDGVHVVRP